MRIAVVHDWLTGWRGGEVVLAEILDLFPDADLFALIATPGSVPPAIERRIAGTSFLSRLPLAGRFHRQFMPLYAAAAESLDLSAYDLVLSSSHAAAKGVRKRAGAVHLCYCHTPARWAWDLFDDYFPRRPLSPAWRFVDGQMARFRQWDRSVSGPDRIDAFAANSRCVADRISRCYDREAIVLPPPADLDFFTPDPTVPRGDFHLMVSALVPYKRVDLALEAFRKRSDRLVVVGSGPERGRLLRMAPANVTFAGFVEADRLRSLYRGARSYLVPGEEDFGIATVEALACGTPVVGLAAGGTAEIVEEGLTGLLFGERSAAALSDAIDRAAGVAFNSSSLRAAAGRFSRRRFRDSYLAWVSGWLGTGAPAGPVRMQDE